MESHALSYADQNLTQELAARRLPRDKVVVGWYTNRQVRQSVTHAHPYHEYIYMVSGRAWYHVDGSRYELRPGELLLIPPGTVHTGYYDTYDRLILQVDDGFWHQSLEGAGAAPALPDRLLILHREPVENWGIRELMERAAAAGGMANESEKELMYRCLLIQLVLSIRQIIAADGVAPPAATSPLVARAVAYLQAHYRDPGLNVNELARHTYVSREHLSRVFRAYTSRSVHDYLTELRMQSCRRDIAAGKRILDACLENGFSDYSSFLRSFRKRYGISPQEYRARLRTALQP